MTNDPAVTSVTAQGAVGLPKQRRPTRPWLVFGIAVTGMMMASLDQAIVSTGLSTLERQLHARVNWAGWTITGYQFGLVIAMPVAGRLSDQFGRRRIFMSCIALFTLSSIGCATSHNIYTLIVFRAFQGLGGGGFTPSAIGLISDHFGPNRDRAVGMVTSASPIGTLTGPILGALIISYWSWRGIFLINIPIGITVFLLTLRFIPKSSTIDAPRADTFGVGLLAGTILPFMYGVTVLGTGNIAFDSPHWIVPVLVSIFFGTWFVRHTNHVEAPIIPLRLLRNRSFVKLNIINFLYGGCTLGSSALVPIYAVRKYHFGLLEAGSVLTARAIGVLALASTTAFMIRRVGFRRPMILGFLLASAGLLLLSITPVLLSTYAWIAVAGCVIGFGNGVAAPSTNNAMLSNSPNEAASISGLRGMFRQFGAIVAISISTAFVARSGNEGNTLGHVFFIFAVVTSAIAIPLALTVPDHRGRW